jgi:DNA end-binding protein Ku
MPRLRTEPEEEEGPGMELRRTVWSGSLSIGLVNIPVKAIPLTMDGKISLRMLHQRCRTPISYKRYCQEGEEVPLKEIVYGYQLERGRYAVIERNELEAMKPESSSIIDLDRFVNFFQVDPHYFEKTYLLIPDGSEPAYALMRRTMEKTGRAAIGRMTMRSRERIVLVHYYQNAIVATSLRYHDEVLDPSGIPELSSLPEPADKELALAREIVDKLTGDLDLGLYEDGYRERIEALVRSKLAGEVIQVERKARPAAKSLMEALRETAASLK